MGDGGGDFDGRHSGDGGSDGSGRVDDGGGDVDGGGGDVNDDGGDGDTLMVIVLRVVVGVVMHGDYGAGDGDDSNSGHSVRDGGKWGWW